MCAGTESKIRNTLPIGTVVLAAHPRLGEVADLVMLIPRCFQHIHRDHKLPGLLVRVHGCFFTLLDHGLQRGFRFNRECVSGYMGHLQFNGKCQVCLPGLIIQARNPVNQIYAEIMDAFFADQVNSCQCFFGRMRTVHPLQVFISEALDADAEPVDALTYPKRDADLIDVIWIHLKTGFCIRNDLKAPAHHLHQGPQFFAEKNGRRTTPKIHRGDQPVFFPPRQVDFLDNGIHHFGFRLQRRRKMKIAVMAGSFAIGYMKIKSGSVICTIDHHQLVLYNACHVAYPLLLLLFLPDGGKSSG